MTLTFCHSRVWPSLNFYLYCFTQSRWSTSLCNDLCPPERAPVLKLTPIGENSQYDTESCPTNRYLSSHNEQSIIWIIFCLWNLNVWIFLAFYLHVTQTLRCTFKVVIDIVSVVKCEDSRSLATPSNSGRGPASPSSQFQPHVQLLFSSQKSLLFSCLCDN